MKEALSSGNHFSVSLLAEVWCDGHQINLRRQMELPFPPFPGLEIEIADYDDLEARQAAAGFPGRDPEPWYTVGRVTWSCATRTFVLHEESHDKCKLGFFRSKQDSVMDVAEHVRYLCDVMGFEVEGSLEPQE